MVPQLKKNVDGSRDDLHPEGFTGISQGKQFGLRHRMTRAYLGHVTPKPATNALSFCRLARHLEATGIVKSQ